MTTSSADARRAASEVARDKRSKKLARRLLDAITGDLSHCDAAERRSCRVAAWPLAELLAHLLGRREPAWRLFGLLEERGQAALPALSYLVALGFVWVWDNHDPDAIFDLDESPRPDAVWVVLTQAAADAARRVPSSDGGLRDPAVSRSVALAATGQVEAAEDRKREWQATVERIRAIPGGLFERARWE